MLKDRPDNTIDAVIVGTKADIQDERAVTFEMGKNLASKYGMPFYEVSAKTGNNVQESFDSLIKKIFDTSYQRAAPTK